MAASRVDRRRILTGAAALGGAGVLSGLQAPAVAFAENNPPADPIVGTWLETITPGDPSAPKFLVLVTFFADGGALASASTDFAPATRSSPGYGVWVRTGPRRYRAHGLGFAINEAGNLGGIAHVRETSIVDAATDQYLSEATMTTERDGKVVFTARATGVGARVVA